MKSRKFGLFFTPPPPIVTHFITIALVLLSQNHRHPIPPKAVTAFMNDPLKLISSLTTYLYY
jgi:hypothetical protein